MTLAQRIRDSRYAKGWGPDELAHRASISRTALYQIESGKTEQPRAGTLRRIAEALSLSTEALLGQSDGFGPKGVAWASEAAFSTTRPNAEPRDGSEPLRFTSMAPAAFTPAGNGWAAQGRELELQRKLGEILRSPLGEGLARIVEESFRLLPARNEAVR